MCRNNIEMAILETEVIGKTTFVSNHTVHCTFADDLCIYICNLREELSFDKAQEEHLPHVKELARNRCESILRHESLDLCHSL